MDASPESARRPVAVDLAEYRRVAEDFYDEAYARIRASRDRAWLVAAGCAGIAGLAVAAVVGLTPLKRVDLIPVVVDKTSGEAHVVQEIAKGAVSEQEAVHKADLATYVIARESFDRSLVNHYYATVATRSDSAVLKPYADQFQTGVPNSIYTRYAGATRAIEVRGVVLLSPTQGQVRFTATLLKPNAAAVVEDFVATVGFQYVTEGMSLAQRLRNPLGFVVTSYRTDQETLPREDRP
jgi:type IV secretion system protein VirB8